MKRHILFVFLIFVVAAGTASALKEPKPAAPPEAKGKPPAKIEGQGGPRVKAMESPDVVREYEEVHIAARKFSDHAGKANPVLTRGSIKEMFQEGNCSLDEHLQDIRHAREAYTRAQGALDNLMWEKVTFGRPTDEDKEVFEKSTTRSGEIMLKFGQLEIQTNRLKSSTSARYVSEGWKRHLKTLEETNNLLEVASRSMPETVAHCR